MSRTRQVAGARRPVHTRQPSQRIYGLKVALIAADTLALAAAWLASFLVFALSGVISVGTVVLFALLGAAIGLGVIGANGLWLARTCAIRSMEIRLLAHASLISGIAMIVIDEVGDLQLSTFAVGVAAFTSFLLLVNVRGVFRWALTSARRRGRFTRPLVLVGWNAEAAELMNLMTEHPGAGFRIVGVVSDVSPPDDLPVPWLASYSFVDLAVRDSGATGGLIVASALAPDDLNEVTRNLLHNGTHVHMSSGLRGIAHDRLRPLPVAYEPLIYVEAAEFSRTQHAVKRCVDVTVASLMSVVVLPVLGLAALAIKLDDGGPLLFKQQRVGKDGRLFTLYKLRTMIPSAEEQLASLREFNGRAGPLFKMARDPRVTRVGRVLRATSIDELPQLLNVVLGTMSLVGPRPALPREVATFDERLRDRARVLPGITGLWQVEARDDPSFARYRRLDMFYVDNWSVGLDLSIMLATIGVVCGRASRFVSRRWTAADRTLTQRRVLD